MPAISRRSADLGTENAFVVLAEQIFIDARAIIEAFEMRLGGKLNQVLPTSLVFAEEDEVVISFTIFF